MSTGTSLLDKTKQAATGLGSTVGQVVKESAKKNVNAAMQQIGGIEVFKEEKKAGAGVPQPNSLDTTAIETPKQPTHQDAQAAEKQQADLLEGLYGASAPKMAPEQLDATKAQKTMEAQQKEAVLKQQLQQMHTTNYYDPTFNRQGPSTQEEMEKQLPAAERVEREKMRDLQESQEKEKKQQPLQVQMGKFRVEQVKGAGG